MAHYAYLDETNTVVTVVVGKDETELIDGLEPEIYYALNTPYTVKRTSYNGNIRFNFASVGDIYDSEADAFISPRPQCGHKELFLNDVFKWNCQRCELDIKAMRNEA